MIGETKLLPLPAGRGRNVGGGVRALRGQGSSRRRTSFGDTSACHSVKPPPRPDAQLGLPNPPELKRPRPGARSTRPEFGDLGDPIPIHQAISGGPATRK